MVGRTLDRYRLLEQVGQGGMAIVYRALDIPLEREVAVKVLHPHLGGHREARDRLQREAQAVAKLRHDNIVEIYASSGPDSPESYIVTEFIHGPTLRSFLGEYPLDLPEIGVLIASEVARALLCAHTAGVLHRDIKPENVMIRRDGTLVLCDFGIAQVVDKDRMTATGQLLGSPAYMAPEHIEGRPLDFRSDVFSLGVLLYQLVTAELPFRGRNPHETLRRITEGRFTPPEELQPLCGARLSRIIEKALSRDPDGRYAQVASLRDDLLTVLHESGLQDPREELRAFFRDPKEWTRAARPRIGRALADLGQRLQREGRTAAALAAWGRAQLLLPGDEEVAALIRSVSRRGRRLWVAALALLGLVLGAGLAAERALRLPVVPAPALGEGAAALRPAPIPEPLPASVAPPVQVPPSAMKEMPPAPAAVRTPPRPRPPAPRLAAQKAPRVVRLAPWPKAVQVSLNGRLLGSYGTDLTSVELPPGPNDLLFENPACYSERYHVPADADPGEIRLRLRWKPALLLVRAVGPKEADVLVEGRLGRAGQVLALPVRTDEGRATVEVKVSAAGYRSAARTVEIRANQLSSIEVPLEPG